MIKVSITCRNINKILFNSTKDIFFFYPQSINEDSASTADILIIDDIGIPDNIDGHTKVLVVGNLTKEKVFQYLSYPNFYGFLTHDISPQLMAKAIRMVEKGEMWVNRRMTSMVFEEFSRHIRKKRINSDLINNLSAREKEVFNLISRGYSNKDVAKDLFISEKTVKTHLKNIFRKLGINKRTEAISLFFQ